MSHVLVRFKKYREVSEVVNEEAKKLARDVLIKPFEGLAKLLPDGRVAAYPDPGTRGHPWTIGYGSTGPDIQPELFGRSRSVRMP